MTTMTIEIPEGYQLIPKLNEQNKQLYILPQPDKEIFTTVPRTYKTIELTDTPAMTTHQIPKLNELGQEMQYELTKPVYEQVSIVDENGVVIGFIDGDYLGQEGIGQYLKLWNTEEIQESDDDDNLLFWKTEQEEESHFEPQQPELIDDSDPRYTVELEKSYDLVPLPTEPVLEPVLSPIEQRLVTVEKTQKTLTREVDQNKEDSAQLNLQMIDVWESLIIGGVV